MTAAKLKYEELYHCLLEELSSIPAGQKFPSVRELMKRYSVGQMTVYMACSQLREEGYLQQIPGKGVFVTDRVAKLNITHEPTLMIAVPHCVSSDIVELAQAMDDLRHRYPAHRLLLQEYDPSLIVPRELPITEENVVGLIVLPSSGNFSLNEVKTLLEYEIPLIVWGWHLDMFDMPSVGTDDLFAGHMAANYLFRRGHHRIGVLVSEPHDCIIMERVKGVRDYCDLHGLELQIIDCDVKRGEEGALKACHKFDEVIKNGLKISALIGVCGGSLQGAINACHRHGVRIPEDLGILSIGGEKITETYFPPITAESLDCVDQIKVALDMVSDPEKMAQKNYYHRPTIIERNSVLDLSSRSRESAASAEI